MVSPICHLENTPEIYLVFSGSLGRKVRRKILKLNMARLVVALAAHPKRWPNLTMNKGHREGFLPLQDREGEVQTRQLRLPDPQMLALPQSLSGEILITSARL
jgi:hypothetical protein